MSAAAQASAAPGDGRRRYYDPRFGATAVRVLPGEHYVTGDPAEMIVTVLGSCISACIRDRRSGVGGMNHFMLPESESGQWGHASAAMRYGNHAMEVLINDIMRRGGRREQLEIKLFGGARIGSSNSDVGQRNIAFIRRWLADEGFQAVAEDMGGVSPRRIHYFPSTGRVKRLALKQVEGSSLRNDEASYRSRLGGVAATAGDIELFD